MSWRTSFADLPSPPPPPLTALRWSSGCMRTRSLNWSKYLSTVLSQGSCREQAAEMRSRRACTQGSVPLKLGSKWSSRIRCGNKTHSTLWTSRNAFRPFSNDARMACWKSSVFVVRSKCIGGSIGVASLGFSSAFSSFFLPFFFLSSAGAAAAAAAAIAASIWARSPRVSSMRNSVSLKMGSRARSPPSCFGSGTMFLMPFSAPAPSPSSRRAGTKDSMAVV
mmetsp:Transcript_66758/g.204268  ORF Transcript_66758/g.204268 Transcript_66758/m.204268 type:complete len:222 (-) Transcript_66758:1318-1983(-)